MEQEHPNKVAQSHVTAENPILIQSYPSFHKPVKRHIQWSKYVVDKNCVNNKLNAINHQYIYPRRMHNIVQGCTMLRKNIPRNNKNLSGIEGFGYSDLNNDLIFQIIFVLVLISIVCYWMQDKKTVV